ncbi:hypothetical protein E3Q06_00563 [Wallemia mellicola]|nr:hypothetical protein E3Q21_00468 [Wallemia mellicola]TIB92501.1 hypothetical protein E3Q20_00213 [Wallemia mellicola]TIC43448.1 hypothetical protein E3Q07_00560 [Wallemia mellicola]TIC52346.1 hypothetical protein E3Q06_00563 [Wallemia mellicola]
MTVSISSKSSNENPYPKWHKMHKIINLEHIIKKSQQELDSLKSSISNTHTKIKTQTQTSSTKSRPQRPINPPSLSTASRRPSAREINDYNSVYLMQTGQAQPVHPIENAYYVQQQHEKYRKYQEYQQYLQYQRYQQYGDNQRYPYGYTYGNQQQRYPSQYPTHPLQYHSQYSYNTQAHPKKIQPSPFDHCTSEDIDKLVAEGKTTWEEVDEIDVRVEFKRRKRPLTKPLASLLDQPTTSIKLVR